VDLDETAILDSASILCAAEVTEDNRAAWSQDASGGNGFQIEWLAVAVEAS
jgi:hypothetical protein